MNERRITGSHRRVLQVQHAEPRHFGARKRQRFLDTLSVTCNVKLSAREAGVGVSTCYHTRARDAGFAEAWQVALAMGYLRLEETLLGYALARADAASVDPDAVDPEQIEGGIHAKIAADTVTRSDLNFALGLLNRRRAGAEKRDRAGAHAVRANRAETDALLKRKLDSLARRLREE